MMTAPDIFLFTADCLRAADASAETMPFCSGFSDIKFTRCFAPGTWTLPSHASLYTQLSPVFHNVAQRGNKLSQNQVRLQNSVRDLGYQTAIFSENVTFSTQTGFHHGVDYVDDSINYKLFPTGFAAENHASDVDLDNAIDIGRAILSTDYPLRNLLNTLYGVYSYGRTGEATDFPHHGERVMEHLLSYVESTDSARLVITNLLDTHNPHYTAPERARQRLGVRLSEGEMESLKHASDDRLYLLDSNQPLPDKAREEFDTWEEVLRSRHKVYRAQIREVDLLLEDWVNALPRKVRTNSLVLVTGDHGQMFGEEDMIGHQTSLHPAGIQVPLLISVPDSWTGSTREVTEPVSLVDLANAIECVARGDVTDTEDFVSKLTRQPDDSPVMSAVDGPTWNTQRLRGDYNDQLVNELEVRKVAEIVGDQQIVYESNWGSDEIRQTEYRLSRHDREELQSEKSGSGNEIIDEWLQTGRRKSGVDKSTSQRLKQLGYL